MNNKLHSTSPRPSFPRKQESRETLTAQPPSMLVFSNQTGEGEIEVRYENGTIWLTQKQMAELFDDSIPTINEHLKNILETEELQADSVIRKFRITAADGKNYNTQHYNLDAILSVGYRANPKRTTEFRQWATQVLREKATPKVPETMLETDSRNIVLLKIGRLSLVWRGRQERDGGGDE